MESAQAQEPVTKARPKPAPKAPAEAKAAQEPAAEVQAEEQEAEQHQEVTAPRIINRHDVSYRHDVYKLEPKAMMKNVSYVHLEPDLQSLDHSHIFHSHNDRGQRKTKCESMGGHWHEIETYVDKQGNLKAKCGPALEEKVTMGNTGKTYTTIVPRSFEKEIKAGEHAGQVMKIVDDHVHEVTYLGSEQLSGKIIREQLKEDKAVAAAMGAVIAPGSVKGTSPKPLTPADGYTLE